ncbi:MAG: hotdog domain-containing protein [Sphingomonas sp.]
MAEVDATAIVFNARYLEYLDIALSEYLRALFGAAHLDTPIRFVRSAIDYRAPCRFDELLDLCIACRRIGRTSITFGWEFHGAGGGEDLRCEGETVIVHVAGARPAPVPDALIAAFERYEGRRLRA